MNKPIQLILNKLKVNTALSNELKLTGKHILNVHDSSVSSVSRVNRRRFTISDKQKDMLFYAIEGSISLIDEVLDITSDILVKCSEVSREPIRLNTIKFNSTKTSLIELSKYVSEHDILEANNASIRCQLKILDSQTVKYKEQLLKLNAMLK